MPRIVISEFMDASAVASLSDGFDVVYDPALVDQRSALLDTLAGADALIVRNRTRVDAEVLAAAPGLKVVGRLGVGLDNIDVSACASRSVHVIPATGANALAVAEYVIAMTMVLLRGSFLATAEIATGGWPRARLSSGRESAGKTLGLVGFGGIGQLTARLARTLGMHVMAHDPMIPDTAAVWAESGVEPSSLDALVARADVVSLHVPLNDGTRGLFDRARIAQMKPGAILINTARGGIIAEEAVAEALREGRLAGAALDVFEVEPLPADSILAGIPNLILTPHIGGVTLESNQRVSSMIAEQVARHLSR